MWFSFSPQNASLCPRYTGDRVLEASLEPCSWGWMECFCLQVPCGPPMLTGPVPQAVCCQNHPPHTERLPLSLPLGSLSSESCAGHTCSSLHTRLLRAFRGRQWAHPDRQEQTRKAGWDSDWRHGWEHLNDKGSNPCTGELRTWAVAVAGSLPLSTFSRNRRWGGTAGT